MLSGMVLRLSPDVPVVWRNPFDVQLGVDEVRLVLRDVSPGQERLLAALTAGVSEAGYSMIAKSAAVEAADAEALLLALEADLVLPRAAPPPRVEVLGTGPVAAGLAALRHRPRDGRSAGVRDPRRRLGDLTGRPRHLAAPRHPASAGRAAATAA